MSVGLRLKEERQRLGLSQADFAALAGATKGAQLKWEKNEAAPNAAALVAFGEGGADIYYILTGKRLDGETYSNSRGLIVFQFQDGYDFDALEAEIARLKAKADRGGFDSSMLDSYRNFLSGVATSDNWPSSSRAIADQLLIAHFDDDAAKDRSANRYVRVVEHERSVRLALDTYIQENGMELPRILYHAILSIIAAYKVDESHVGLLLEGLREMSHQAKGK